MFSNKVNKKIPGVFFNRKEKFIKLRTYALTN
jgi:hypothetical protein